MKADQLESMRARLFQLNSRVATLRYMIREAADEAAEIVDTAYRLQSFINSCEPELPAPVDKEVEVEIPW